MYLKSIVADKEHFEHADLALGLFGFGFFSDSDFEILNGDAPNWTYEVWFTTSLFSYLRNNYIFDKLKF